MLRPEEKLSCPGRPGDPPARIGGSGGRNGKKKKQRKKKGKEKRGSVVLCNGAHLKQVPEHVYRGERRKKIKKEREGVMRSFLGMTLTKIGRPCFVICKKEDNPPHSFFLYATLSNDPTKKEKKRE